ncbi:MAG: prolyl oligopeptidase family serine peptidase [Candidatus Latescibacterota bacterium]
MRRAVCAGAGLLLVGVHAAPGAPLEEETAVEGFARVVSAASSGAYAGNRGARVASSWEYATLGDQSVVWESAPLPALLPPGRLALVWSCGLSRQQGPHLLVVGGRPCLTFHSGVPAGPVTWEEGECALRFEPWLIDDAGDVHGLMRLSLPAAGLTPGQPLRLQVTGAAGGGGTWFMLHHYADSEAHASAALVALPSGRRLMVSPPRSFFVAPQPVAWDCPLVLGGPAASGAQEEVTVAARLTDAPGGTELARTTRVLWVGGNQPRVHLELWPSGQVPEGEHLLELTLTAPAAGVLGTWHGSISVRHLAAATALLEQVEGALMGLEADAALGGLLREVVLPTLAWTPARLRRQVASWTTQEEMEAGVGPLQAELTRLAADVAALQRGRDPLQGRTGCQWRAYRSEWDGRLQPYALYVPVGFRADRSYPLVVMLHGFTGDPMGSLRLVIAASVDSAAGRPGPDYLVVAPYNRDNAGYTNPVGEEDVWRVIADVERAYPVDEDRVYLTGLSMGGGGTLHLGLRYADRFAAIAAVCGWSDWRVWSGGGGATPPARQRVLDAVNILAHAENALNLPVRLVHGAADSVVSPEHSRRLAARLEELGYRVEYEEHPGVGHNSWDLAYQDGRIFSYFDQFRRDPHPQHVVHVTASPERYGHSYWTRVEALSEPHRHGRLEARRLDGARIAVQTRNLDAFWLDLRPRVARPGAPLTVEVDGQVCFKGPAPDSLAFHRQGGTFAVGPGVTPRRAAPFGGLAEALEDWRSFVYGTGGTPEENESMRAAAEDLAAVRGPVDIAWPVVADTAAAAQGLRGTRVLVGCPRTHRALALLADSLPARVAGDTIEVAGQRYAGADLLLLMVRPDPGVPGGRLAVVAGTGPASYRAVSALRWATPDWAVLRAEGTVVAEGLCDAAWQPLPAAP